MATTLSTDFEAGSSGVQITSSNESFNGVSSAGVTYDSAQKHGGTLSAKCVASSTTTRGMWWNSAMGGNQVTIYDRFYLRFGSAPPDRARFNMVQSGGSVLAAVCLTTGRQVQVRNVKAGTTPSGGTSTTVLATNTWHRVEVQWVMSSTNTTCTVRIFAGANVEGTTPDETLSTSGMALNATTDSVFHGIAFSAAQTWTAWVDDVAIQIGSGATWLGPTSGGGGGGGGGGSGDFKLIYDSNTDPWTTTSNMTGSGIALNHSWASLPSKMAPYVAAQSNWGFTAPENITSGTYADGSRYIQLEMKKLKASDAHARYGAGDYGCRFKFDVTATSIKTGRVQWDEEWSGGAKSKTSFMGWPDTGNWPAAGERDLCEQWGTGSGVQVTFHRFDSSAKDNNGQLINHATGCTTTSRVTIRVTILGDRVTWEYKPHGTSTWLQDFPDITGATKTHPAADPSWWQPDKGYHIEGAVAYGTQVSKGASTNDPGRQASVRRISNIKVWSGTTPGPGTDSTAPTPNPPTAPSAAVFGTGPSVLVSLTACTDSDSGIGHYTLQRAYDSVGSPGTPDVATIVTFDNLTSLQYVDTGTAVGDKVYYRESATDGADNTGSYSSWSTMLTVTGPTGPPVCVGAVAPADGSTPPGDSATVLDSASGVIFSAPSTIGADQITVDPGDGLGNILTINPSDAGADPNTGSVLYAAYPSGPKTYTATFTAINSYGPATDDVTVHVIEAPGTTATPTPRDIWVVPGQPAYRVGDLVDNALYNVLNLDTESDIPTLVQSPYDSAIVFCVDAGPAGPEVTDDSGGGDGGSGDSEVFGDVFDDTF